MKLEKLILVNWGALRTDEYAIGNMTLLTGPTGSGKSTLLDALQTVMTAVHQNIFSYNPGQDETSQTARKGKTKRTLWSYIVGAEDNLFARPDGAHGYVAAVFQPDGDDHSEGFTALVGAAARVEGAGERRQAVGERLALVIVDDAALALEDLMDYDEGGLRVIEVERIERHLRARYAQVTHLRDAKREYLCQLYGRFRGQRSVSFAEAELAAKAWTQSIAHKPIGSVDELVRTQIMEHDPQQLAQRISQISGLMRQVHALRVEGERLEANVTRLEEIGDAISRAMAAHETAVLQQLALSRRNLCEDERRIGEARRAAQALESEIRAENGAIEALDHDRKAHVDSQIQIAARLSGIPAAEQKRRIEQRLDAARENAHTAAGMLLEALAQAEKLRDTAQAVVGMGFPPNHRLLEKAAAAVASALARCRELPFPALRDSLRALHAREELDTLATLEAVRALEGLDRSFEGLFEDLAGTGGSFVAAVHGQAGQLEKPIQEARDKEKILAERKANLAEGGADYPREIGVALRAFKTDLPGAGARVLCDLIEPRNEAWQPAIEGYLGGARFNFVVDPDWEARAIEFVRARHLRAKVIQGSLCRQRARPELVPPDSVIHELHTDHPVAQAYLVEQYGAVVKVSSAEELRHTPRGLMQDGKGSGSRTLFTSDVDNLVFGKEAQRLARERVAAEHSEAEQRLSALLEQQNQVRALLALVQGLRLPSFAENAALERACHDSDSARADLARLDLTEVIALEAEKKSLEKQIDVLQKEINAANRRIGDHERQIASHRQAAERLETGLPAKQERVGSDGERLRGLCQVNDSLSFTALEQKAEAIAGDPALSNLQLQDSIQRHAARAHHDHGDVRAGIADYNLHAHTEEQLALAFGTERTDDFAPTYRGLVELRQRLRRQLEAQKETGLVRNLDQLRTAESSFKDVFTKQFCYEIRNAVDSGVKSLRVLNSELSRLKFGTDRFKIDWSQWVPEFKEYYDFFCAAYDLSESRESGDLFASEELSPENCKVRDRLVALLLSDDQERSLQELQRVADYRNYRRYEIWKESDGGSRVALSEWGTGSGGQLETPAYIVRAAVVTNRLKQFDKGTSLKLLVNDESFAKMDERRAHDVIRFIRDSLGLQLICAMPTKHAGALKSEFTKEWSFTRTRAEGNGEVDFVSEADERDLNPDRLRELWALRRRQVREQAQLEFEAEEDAVGIRQGPP